jgi:hypothetical protein
MKSKVKNSQTKVYLDHRLAAPGDVLLQLGEGRVSAAIARTTMAPFSHAAILVASTIMYEALDDGVLPTTLPLVAVQAVGDGVRLAAAMSDVRAARLLRHANLEQDVVARRFDVADEFMEKLLEFVGRRYADTCDLLRAAPSGSPLRALGSWLKSNSTRGRLPRSKRGIFCSELVARTYAAVGLPLFEKVTPAGRVNPGDLIGSPFLHEVQGGVFFAQQATPTPQMTHFIEAAKKNLLRREDYADWYKRAEEIDKNLQRQEEG